MSRFNITLCYYINCIKMDPDFGCLKYSDVHCTLMISARKVLRSWISVAVLSPPILGKFLVKIKFFITGAAIESWFGSTGLTVLLFGLKCFLLAL